MVKCNIPMVWTIISQSVLWYHANLWYMVAQPSRWGALVVPGPPSRTSTRARALPSLDPDFWVWDPILVEENSKYCLSRGKGGGGVVRNLTITYYTCSLSCCWFFCTSMTSPIILCAIFKAIIFFYDHNAWLYSSGMLYYMTSHMIS